MTRKRKPWMLPQLVVETSMDAVLPLLGRLHLNVPDLSMFQKALRQAVEGASSPGQTSLWDASLHRLAESCGPAVAESYKAWSTSFPCDADEALPVLSAWERVWPDVANRLRATKPGEWASEISDSYWTMTDDHTYRSALALELEKPLST